MAYIKEVIVDVTTDGAGAATAYGEAIQHGLILDVFYVKDGTTPFSDGVDFDITLERYGVELVDADNVNASAHWTPRQIAHLNSDSSAGTAAQEPIPVVNDRVKIVVASGGATKLGRFVIQVG